MRTILALFLSLLLGTADAQQLYLGKVGPVAAPIATINVNTANPGITIPTNFVGFSGEVSDLIGGYYQGTTGTAASMLGLMKLMGTCGSLRIGGASSDSTPTAPALTQTIANNLQAFAANLGSCWTVFYGVDFKINNAATAATHAGFIATAFGAANVIFQFGNEPELYTTPAAYITQWNSYYTTISGAVPGLKVAAWDSGDFADTPTVIAGLTPGLTGMSAITQHFYTANSTAGSIQHILTVLRNQNVPNGFYINNGYAKSGGVPQRMVETNSVDGGGFAGLSNTLGGAAWIAMEMAILANAGWGGVNVHGYYIQVPGFPANPQYNPLVQLPDTNFGPGVDLYSMFLFSKLSGQQILPSSVGGGSNIYAIATKGGGGNANIFVTNADVFHPVSVKPSQSSAWTTANVLQIRDADNQGCASTSLTVGGQPIGESGTWTGTPYTISNGQSIVLGPCQTALIQIQP